MEELKTSVFDIPHSDKQMTIVHFVDKDIIDSFLNSLDSNALKTIAIAYEHLGSSFDLEKCNLFIKWFESR